jgi:hypothetical protein
MRRDFDQITRMDVRQIYWKLKDRLRDKTGNFLPRIGFGRIPPHVFVQTESVGRIFDALDSMFSLSRSDCRAELESRLEGGCGITGSMVREAESIVEGRLRLWGETAVDFSPRKAESWYPGPLGMEAVHSVQRCYFLGKLGLAFLATGRSEFLDFGVDSVDGWLELNPIVRTPAWGSMNISERIPQWLLFMFCAGGRIGENRAAKWLSSVLSQSVVLSRHPEFASANNHLLFNARTLLMVGHIFSRDFSDANRFSYQARKILDAETERQFGSDGAHLESCGGYQLWTTQCLAECVLLESLSSKSGASPGHSEVLSRALDVLRILQLPDGEPAPVGDYKDCDTPYTVSDVLLAGARALKRAAVAVSPGDLTPWSLLWGGRELTGAGDGPGGGAVSTTDFCASTGYAVWRHAKDPNTSYMLMKAGPVSALTENPGHGHADALSVILWLEGLPVVVDSGTYTYEAGEPRDYFRGVESHNTIQIGGHGQAVFWSAFRTAFLPVVTSSGIEGLGESGFSTSATIELKIPGDINGARHSRRVSTDDGTYISIRDTVTSGKRSGLVSRIHLHPMWEGQNSDDDAKTAVFVARDSQRAVLVKAFKNNGDEWVPLPTRIADSRYSPNYGVTIRNRCIVLDCETDNRGRVDLLTIVTMVEEQALADTCIKLNNSDVARWMKNNITP